MPKVLIVYYSRTGDTEKMAGLVAEGVRQIGCAVETKAVKDAKPADLKDADGIILGSPAYYGSMAGDMKKFVDESVKCHGALVGKVGGAFSCSHNVGGGSESAVMALLMAMLAHGMIIPGAVEGPHFGPVAIGTPDGKAAESCRRMGETVGRLVVRLAGK